MTLSFVNPPPDLTITQHTPLPLIFRDNKYHGFWPERTEVGWVTQVFVWWVCEGVCWGDEGDHQMHARREATKHLHVWEGMGASMAGQARLAGEERETRGRPERRPPRQAVHWIGNP